MSNLVLFDFMKIMHNTVNYLKLLRNFITTTSLKVDAVGSFNLQIGRPRLPLEELDLDASANVVPKESEAKQGLESKSSETVKAAEPVEEENLPVGVPSNTFAGIGLEDDSLLDAVQPV